MKRKRDSHFVADRKNNGVNESTGKNTGSYTSGQVVDIIGISIRQLYYWELKGIIKPIEVMMGSRRFKRYTNRDIYILRKIKDYLDMGFTLETTFKKVALLCGYINGTRRI